MSEFPYPLKLSLDIGGRTATLTSVFVYITDVVPEKYGYDTSMVIVVPSGFKTDFASVPAPFWWLIDKVGTQAWPAVIHDYLYSQKKGRKWADAVFMEALKVSGAPMWKRIACWAAVRMFGRSSWDNQ